MSDEGSHDWVVDPPCADINAKGWAPILGALSEDGWQVVSVNAEEFATSYTVAKGYGGGAGDLEDSTTSCLAYRVLLKK